MEDIYVNVATRKPSAASPNQPGLLGPRAKGTGRRVWGPAALGLGLLCVSLLTGLLLLGVRHSVTQSELMERQKELSTLGEERSRLNSSLFSLKQRKQTCPEGWRKFENACYHHSDQGNSWNNSRNDCMEKGGDLVVIDSSQEQKFLSEYKEPLWIGLSDLEQEGTWKWVDGAPLILSYWEKNQPDNGNNIAKFGKENCAQIRFKVGHQKWNDISCNANLGRICETSPEDA